MYIVGFNGPPQCGKDTLAEVLADFMDTQNVILPIRMESLSMPLRHIAYAMTGFKGRFDGAQYENFKRLHFPQFKKTGREIMIDISERFLKTVYGQQVMADMLLSRNEGFTGILLVRDCGFACEIHPIEQAVGPSNFCLIQVSRPGKTFDGDSRGWVTKSDGSYWEVHNGGPLHGLRYEASILFSMLVNHLGWKL